MNLPQRWSRWTDACWAGLAAGSAGISLLAYVAISDDASMGNQWTDWIWPVLSVLTFIASLVGLFWQYRKNPVVARSFTQLRLGELVCVPPVIVLALEAAKAAIPYIAGYYVAPVLGLVMLWAMTDANRRGMDATGVRILFIVGSVPFALGVACAGFIFFICVGNAFGDGFGRVWMLLTELMNPWHSFFAGPEEWLFHLVRWSILACLPLGWLLRFLAQVLATGRTSATDAENSEAD